MGGTCSCRGRQNQVNSGSILDRVISQAGNEDQCLLYRLANYKKGGELIESYNQGGQQEVERVMREQFGILMYADGKGQTINRAEYLRWKFRDQDQVILPIEASLSRFDPLSQWSDHEACWQMQYRGSLGESLLHVLIICDSRVHTRIARTLLKCFPRLAIDVVEGEEYLGASALHLAIAYNNNELVQDLVEAGAIVNQRATGSFFLPRDQQRHRPAKNTDYEGLAYLGEYPLAWAACCANESAYNLLLDSGADPDEQDSFGNMILHMVVVCDKLDMFGYALRHPKLPARNGIVNSAGLTPLTLACQLGRAEVFREMLELSCREFWRYSNITCSAYPLNALDTLLPDGRTNWNSALFIILNGTKEEHLAMLDGGIIQKLLEEKWKTFARLQFLKRLIILVFHLASLSLAVYLRPAEIDAQLLKWPEEITDVGRTIAECITVVGVLGYILVQLGGEIVNVGLPSFLKQLSNEPAKFIFLISNLLILACIPCRLSENRLAEDAILIVAVPGSWFLLMFFAGAIRLTGPFVTMIYSMITGDMLTFGIIYTIVLFGFSQSFHFLYKGFPGVKSTLYYSYPSTWMALFQITLGDYSRVGKVTINELRKRGMTGEELRCIMWGRASFSTPVRASLNIENGETMPGVFGDALTAALDVMVLSHDIELPPGTNDATNIMNQNLKTPNAMSQVTSNGQVRAVTNGRQIESIAIQQSTMNNSSLTQVQAQDKSAKSVKPVAPTVTNVSKSQPNSVNRFGVIIEADKSSGIEENPDPLLALVITSEVEGSNPKTLLKLAESSRLLSEASLKPVKPTIDPTILEGFSITNLAIAATMKSTLIRKQYFIESSDNDVCGNDYLLGTEARLRRIKSANSRYVTTKRKSGQDDGSSSSSPSVENNSGYHLLLNEPEDISSQQPKSSLKVVDSKSTETTSKTQNGKNHKRRPKTARNRISPKETSQSESKVKMKEEESVPSSPTDPLEPWSTRGITDMNTILAWKETTPDSP
ncbi:uncharacterized protein LOC122498536 isoform X4 [Leptopilina heterotoma]|uniref:uncharacterized protein LOC122498536 isoform X4 n=1 Tax=Leptopilina heterotoma TaxID=63436 RepID=UPI001CA84C69|nr:uncharacterized protein LOC122498536 isoform X4 [Leptopilina heterotoma]